MLPIIDIVTNGDLEDGVAPFELEGSAVYTNAKAYDGSFSVELIRSAGLGLPAIRYENLTPLVAGWEATLGFAAHDGDAVQPLVVQIDFGDGSLVNYHSVTKVGSSWRLFSIPFTPIAPVCRFRLLTTGPNLKGWYVDAFSCLTPSRVLMATELQALEKLSLALQEINGPPQYNFSLGGVHMEHRRPKERKGWKLPYLCLPQAGEVTAPKIFERGLVELTLKQSIVGYVEDTVLQGHDSQLVMIATLLRQDIWNALLGDLRLGGAVHDLKVASVRSEAGTDPEQRHAEVWFVLDLNIAFQRSDLPPQ
jgi:hypothetical protein